MLSLGAHVVSVEPQPDLALALKETVALNCWEGRATVINAFACIRDKEHCMRERRSVDVISSGRTWRWGGVNVAAQAQLHALARQGRTPAFVRGVTLRKVLLNSTGASRAAVARGQPMRYRLIKMDGDGPEGQWCRELQRLLVERSIEVDAMIIEGSHLSPTVMSALQREHGYTAYRLDDHDGRRFITSKGWDAYSPRGTFGRLDRLGGLERDALEEELFGVRAMRHVFRVRANASGEEWKTLLQPVNRYPPQWVLTKEGELMEPAFQSATFKRSKHFAAANSSGYLKDRSRDGFDGESVA